LLNEAGFELIEHRINAPANGGRIVWMREEVERNGRLLIFMHDDAMNDDPSDWDVNLINLKQIVALVNYLAPLCKNS